jgi:hypothetical protein
MADPDSERDDLTISGRGRWVLGLALAAAAAMIIALVLSML